MGFGTRLTGLLRAVVAGMSLMASFESFAACLAEPSNAVAWFRAENDAVDTHGGSTGTNSGTYATGRVGQAFSFNGTSGYVSVPDGATLEPASVTVEGWINFSTAPISGTRMIFSKPVGTGTANSYSLFWENGYLISEISDGLSTRPRALALWSPAAGTWYHVATTFDSATQALSTYLNGSLLATNTPTGIQMAYGGTNPLMIGAESDNGSPAYFFPGLIDEVTIYSRALTVSEIASIHTAGVDGKCVPPALTALRQDLGGTAGGGGVTLEGSNLSSVTSVTFDGVAASIIGTPTTTSVTVAAPPHVAAAVPVIATSSGGGISNTLTFFYYDDDSVARDYSIAANPSPRWTYGWKPTTTGTFTAYNTSIRSTTDKWATGGDNLPNVSHNPTQNAIVNGSQTIPAYGFAMHPGASGEYSVARWTAPGAATYAISGYFSGLDSGGTSTDVWILKNGSTTLFNGYVSGSGAGSYQYFSSYVTLSAGQTLDFMVGKGVNDYSFDATGLDVTIMKVSSGANVVTNTADTGSGSLRAAIEYINSISCEGANTIIFNIGAPGTGPHTISPATPLPTLACGMTIDGYTQFDASANSDSGGSNNANLQVILDGAGCTGSCDGLVTLGSGAWIKGLSIHSFTNGAGIRVTGGSVLIHGNYIGTDPGGMSALGNGSYGINVAGGSAYIGQGGDPASRNLITANGAGGVFVGAGGGCLSAGPSEPTSAAAKGAKILGAYAELHYNQIGGKRDGGSGMGNSGPGVEFSNPGACGSNPYVEANYIRYNSGAGVVLTGGEALELHQNSIYGNTKTAFDLYVAGDAADGVTANDPGDVDSGPNQLVNKPEITSVTYSGSDVTITAQVQTSTSMVGSQVRFDYFHNDTSPSVPEGKFYMGFGTGTVDAGGVATNTTTISGFAGQNITATATYACVSPCSGTLMTSEYSYPKTAAPTATASFSVASAHAGVPVTFNVQASNPNSFAEITGLAISVSMPAGLVVQTAVPGGDCTSSGSYSNTSSSASLSLTGIPAGGTCTFALTVYANSAVTYTVSPAGITITSDAGGAVVSSIPSLTATSSPPTLEVFIAASVQAGAATPLTIAVTRTSTQPSFTAMSVTMTLPGGATISTAPTYGCPPGTGSAATGASVVAASNGAWNSNGTCSFVFTNVTFPAAGTYTLSVNAGDFTWKQGVSSTTFASTSAVQATVTVGPPPVPAVSLSPNPLAFPDTAAGSSALSSVTLTNTGNATLAISSVATSGSPFTVGTPAEGTTCSTSLAATSSCVIKVKFSPGAVGGYAGTLSVTSNASGSPHTVSLSGGTGPSLSMSVSSLTFSPQEVGTASGTQAVTFSNPGSSNLVISAITIGGTHAGDFAFTGCSPLPVTIAPGGSVSCAIFVKFTPAAGGARTAIVTIQSNASNGSQTVSLSGTGAVASVSISPSPAAFGSVVVNTTTTLNVVIGNTGTIPVNVSSVTISGTGFTHSHACTTIAVGGSCPVAVTFAPTTAANHAGTLTITSNASGSPHDVSMSGTGTAPGVSLTPTPVAFGNVPVGGSASATLTLTNTGTATLSISAFASSGAPFTHATTCGTSLAAGQSCPVTVTYAPTAAGSHAGQLSVTTNASATPTVAALSGNATVPGISVSPSPAAFGNVVVGSTASLNLIVTNTGGAPLQVSAVAIAGSGFAQANGCTVTSLAPGATCQIAVTFSPAATGAHSGSVSITSNASGSPHVVSLSGTGTAPGVSLTPTPVAFGNVPVGTTATSTLTLQNTGTALLTIGGIAATGTFFTQAHACPTSLAAGASCAITVTYAPASAGSHTGELSVTTNASATPTLVPLSGTGAVPALALSAASLDFGSQTVNVASTTQSVTVSNTGNAPLTISSIGASGDFGFTGCATPLTLAPGASCALAIKFFPTATGARSGSISIASNASGSPHAVSLSGTGTPAPTPAVSIAPASHNFGTLVAGTTATQVFAVSNPGTATLTISSIALASPTVAARKAVAYSQANTCSAPLAPNTSCHVTVTFAPAVEGSHAAELQVFSNAVPSPLVAALSGTASPATSPALTLSSSTVAFDPQFVGTTSGTRTVTLTSSGTAPLVISSVTTAGDFGYAGCGAGTMAPGATCDFAITFRPLSDGPHAGSITIHSNAAGGPHLIALSGTGSPLAAPEISLTPSALAFGTVRTGRTSSLTVRLTNSGEATLVLSGISAHGPYFAAADSCPSSLEVFKSCDITVTYEPKAEGTHGGQLVIQSNAIPSPFVAALSGTGATVPPPLLVVEPPAVAFGSQVVGTTARRTLVLRNTGGDPLTINAMPTFGSAAFGVEGACATIAPETSCNIVATFTPTATAEASGRLDIQSNSSAGVVQVALSGTGVPVPQPELRLSVAGMGFPTQAANTRGETRSVTLSSVGQLPVELVSFDWPSDYQVNHDQCPAQLQPGSTCDVSVTFFPIRVGTAGGALTITSNARGSPHRVALTGVGCRFFSFGSMRNPQRLCGG